MAFFIKKRRETTEKEEEECKEDFTTTRQHLRGRSISRRTQKRDCDVPS